MNKKIFWAYFIISLPLTLLFQNCGNDGFSSLADSIVKPSSGDTLFVEDDQDANLDGDNSTTPEANQREFDPLVDQTQNESAFGSYKAYVIFAEGDNVIDSADNVTSAQASIMCRNRINSWPHKTKIRCEFNGKQFLSGSNVFADDVDRPVPQVNSSLATFRAEYMSRDNDIIFKRNYNVTKSQALVLCDAALLDKAYAGKNISCYWGAELIKSKTNTTSPDFPCFCADKPGTYEGFFIYSDGTKHRFIMTRNINIEDAAENCRINTQSNPHRNVYCTFNGVDISKGVPSDSNSGSNSDTAPTTSVKGLYEAYLSTFDGENRIDFADNVTQEQALVMCKNKILGWRSNANIFCEFNGKRIFSSSSITEGDVRQPLPGSEANLDTFKAEYSVRDLDVPIKTSYNLTKTQAEELCNNILNDPKYAGRYISCYWGQEFLKAETNRSN